MTEETLAKGRGQNKHDRENLLLSAREDSSTPIAGADRSTGSAQQSPLLATANGSAVDKSVKPG